MTTLLVSLAMLVLALLAALFVWFGPLLWEWLDERADRKALKGWKPERER